MLLYEDNNACMAMGNAQKPTPWTQHIVIKYFSLCNWVAHDLMLLECIDIKTNMYDHFAKNLSPTLFHHHTDFIMGHILPPYSPVHSYLIGICTGHDIVIDQYVPTSFTSPITVAIAQVFAPISDDYLGNPWTLILWHGCTIHH